MAELKHFDTIASIATGAGSSGILLIRLSGQKSLAIADCVFVAKGGRRPSSVPTHTVHYGWIVDGTQRVDEVLLTVMRAPRSYTREDVVEISCHGGAVVGQRVLDLVLKAGARGAQPGEFTQRAFLNGRIDLAQAEAVADIISAKTEVALTAGMIHLSGALSRRLSRVRATVTDALAQLEARIDFPHEDTFGDTADAEARFKQAYQVLNTLLAGARAGGIVREGMRVVICGRPNAGKSSLLNALLKEERSIVTPVPGTTRDAVEAFLDIRGIPVSLADTAGILRPHGLIEKKARATTARYARKAHLILLVIDASVPITREDQRFLRSLPRKPTIGVLNKIDRPVRVDRRTIAPLCSEVIEVSAKKRKNLGLLEDALYRFVFAGCAEERETGILLNARQAQLLGRALDCVRRAAHGLRAGIGVEFAALDAKDACKAMDEVLGKVYSDDVIERIFSRFCIGK